MSTESKTSSCPVVSVIVPVSPDWNVITSAPAAAFASAMAWRRVPAPLSLRLETVNVAAFAAGAAASAATLIPRAFVAREDFDRTLAGTRRRDRLTRMLLSPLAIFSGTCWADSISPVRMRLDREFVRLPLTFDAARLAEEIAQFDEGHWRPHPQ